MLGDDALIIPAEAVMLSVKFVKMG